MGHRYLSRTLLPLKHYLGGQDIRRKLRLKDKNGQLLPPLHIAWLRGEAILRLRFFEMLEQQRFSDYAWQLELWEKLVLNRGYIIDLLQRIQIGERIEGGHEQIEDGAFKLYCILLDTLHRENEQELLNIATTELFRHHIKSLYPKKAAAARSNPQQLRHSATIKIRKYWGASAQLKESFTTQPDSAHVQLRLKLKGYAWYVLLEVSDKRLKRAKTQAYQQLLDGLKEGRYRPETTQLQALRPVVSSKKC